MRIYESENSVTDVVKAGHDYNVHLQKEKKDIPLVFQDGAVKEVGGRNGLQNEEVLAVLIDRLEFLNKKNPCRENSIVITKLQEAQMWLERRTALRKKQDVEGTTTPHKS